MDFQLYDVILTLSLLVMLVVIVRLYNALKVVNARVTLLSGLAREMRQALVLAGTIPAETPGVEGSSPAGEPDMPSAAGPTPPSRPAGHRSPSTAFAWSEAEEADRHLEGALARDFTMQPRPSTARAGAVKSNAPRGPIKLGSKPK